MKIRTDYVSNSSSSSFVVVLPKDYAFKKFIGDVAQSCVDNPDLDCYTNEDIELIKDDNIRNMDYCLNTYELLFLGTFCYEYNRSTIKGKDEVYDFMKSIEFFKNKCPEMFRTKIVSQTEDELVVDIPNTANGCAVSRDIMNGFIHHYYGLDEDDTTFYHSVVEAIEEYLSKNSFWDENRPGLFEITMNTIYNTEALLAERKDSIKLDKWCSDLGVLKKLIADGNRIFGIEMHQSGDGQTSTSIYALAGWNSNAFKYSDVQILDSEWG